MNKTNLPDFVTFKNFDGALNLISKKEVELNKLHSALSFKKFMNIFEFNSDLKSLRLENKYIYGENILWAVHATYFNGKVIDDDKLIFNLVSDILGYDNPKRILAVDGLVIGRDSNSSNKLKSIFNIKSFSNKCINKMVGNSVSLMDEVISAGFDNVKHLNQQVLVVGLLRLFEKHPNLKRISLKVNGILIGTQTSDVNVLLSDDSVDDSKVITDRIKGLLLNKRFNNPVFLHHNYISININKNNLSNIRKLIKCMDGHGVSLDDFYKVLEREILEENISQSVIMNKPAKMKI